MTQQQLSAALEAFLISEDFKSGVISSTKASWSGGDYRVELFPDGSHCVLWSNEIGNLYETPGAILALPALDTGEDYSELVVNGDMSDDEFLSNQFNVEYDDIVQILRDALKG